MRARLLPVTPLVVAVALLAAGPVGAHLTPEPSFVAAGSEQRLVLTVHNDRDATMTGFRLTVPEGLRILAASGEEGWSEAVDGARATWTGGVLEPLEPVVFEVDVAVAALEPGTVELRGDQLYQDGESVTWPVSLTVVPPRGDTGEGVALTGTAIAILAILAALVVATFGLVLWQRSRNA